jgi:hypothetical protein
MAGFSVPALVGALSYVFGLSDTAVFAPLVVAGAFEGAILGLTQASVLRRWIDGLSRRHWVVATAVAASSAWALGLSLAFVAGRSDSVALLALLSGVVVPLILCSIGGAQWLVLRRHLPRAGWWIVANACAWLAALPLCIGVISAVPSGAPAAAVIAAALMGGALMGLTLAAITGMALVRILSTAGDTRRTGNTPFWPFLKSRSAL